MLTAAHDLRLSQARTRDLDKSAPPHVKRMRRLARRLRRIERAERRHIVIGERYMAGVSGACFLDTTTRTVCFRQEVQ